VLEEVQLPVSLDNGVMHGTPARHLGMGMQLPAVKSIWIVSRLAAAPESTPLTNHGSLIPNAASNSLLCVTYLRLLYAKTATRPPLDIQQRRLYESFRHLPHGARQSRCTGWVVCICFADKLIFKQVNILTQWLHHRMPLEIHTRLHQQDKQMALLPVNVGDSVNHRHRGHSAPR
jgi:hypothetical protein